MIGFNNKKKGMKDDTEDNKINLAKIKLSKELPEIKNDILISVPQARLILNKDNKDIMNFEVEYTPDEDSLWFGGKYLFSFHFPDNYPFIPPKVVCKTKIYHPNIDFDGNVCLNILREDWNPTLTGSNAITGVYILFEEPNPNDPLNQEAAQLMRENLAQFKENVKKTLKGGYHFGQNFPRFI